MQIGPVNVFAARRGVAVPELDVLAEERLPLAKRLRNAFFRAYNYFNKQPLAEYGQALIPQWDGGMDRNGRIYKSCWGKIAGLIRSRKIDDAERFVLAQFAARADKRIFPTMLLAKDAVDIYKEYAGTADAALHSAMISEADAFARAVAVTAVDGDKKAKWRAVLSDMTHDISPLMRYIIAASEGMRDVADTFRKSAALQFLLDPHGYMRVWGRVSGVRDILATLADEQYA